MAREEEKGQGEEEEVNALSGRGQSGRRGRRPEVESRGKFRPWKLSRDRAKEKESAERLQERGDKGRREKRLLVLLIKGIQRRRALPNNERAKEERDGA